MRKNGKGKLWKLDWLEIENWNEALLCTNKFEILRERERERERETLSN